MRKLTTGLVFSTCLLVAAGAASAQDELGWQGVLFGGWAQGDLSGSNQPFSSSESRDGLTAGAGFMLRTSHELGWEFGLRYSQKGADGVVDLTDYTGPVNPAESVEGAGTTKLDYIEVPVAIAGYLPTGQKAYLRGYLGVSFGVLLSASFEGVLEGEPADVDIKDQLEDWDLCWLIGASWTYDLASVSLWIDGRYVGGTRSIDKSSRDFDVKTSTREFSAGVGIPLGW